MRTLTIAVVLLACGCAKNLLGPAVPKLAEGEHQAGYFGYAAAPPSGQAEPERAVYLWIPEAMPHVTVRMLAPPGTLVHARETDVVAPEFAAHAQEETSFDPFIRLERCERAVNPADVLRPCPQWIALAENDDAAELPAGKSGERTHAQLHHVADQRDVNRALVRGLYRVVYGTKKGGPVLGPFALRLATPAALQGAHLAPTQAAVAEALRQVE